MTTGAYLASLPFKTKSAQLLVSKSHCSVGYTNDLHSSNQSFYISSRLTLAYV